MTWLIAAGYGLASAVAFFVYLCWFRSVRDNTSGAGRRLLYYFLIAVTFVILGRLTGISVLLGVLPMLFLLLFIPKEGLGQILAWAVVIGIASCINFYAPIDRAVQELATGPSATKEQPDFKKDELFISDAWDRELEYEIVENVNSAIKNQR